LQRIRFLARRIRVDPARLRFSGLQKDSSRAQSCPSKHPDGYVEALFWRPFPASSGR